MTTREVSYNLAGTVRNMSLPVAGTTIVLYDYWNTAEGLVRHYLTEHTTGPKGDFSFDVRKGIYSLEVIPNRDTRFARQSIDTVKVNTNTTLTIQLKHGCLYRGTVRSAAGNPQPNCELHFRGIEPEAVSASERTKDNGTFEVSLPKGKYQVVCKSVNPMIVPGGTGKGVYATFLSPTMKTVELWGDLKEDFTLPDMVAFKGVVTNSENHPVQSVSVTISPSASLDLVFNTELKGVCYSSKVGQFECLVEPGTYDVKLEPGPDMHLSERKVNSIVVDQPRTRTYSLGQGYRLYGTVSFGEEPVANAFVSVTGGQVASSAVTDEKGFYSFALSGGHYTVTVHPQPDSLARLPFRLLAPHTFSINLAEDSQKDVQLEPGVMISGKLLDKSGKPRPGVELSLFEAKDEAGTKDASVPQMPLAFSLSSDDGSFEFRVLAGSYRVIANNQQSTEQRLDALSDDVYSDLIWQSGCLVSFEIVSENEEAIPHCLVRYEQYGPGQSEQPNSELPYIVGGDDGVCNMVLDAGIYSFHLEPPEQGSFQPKQIRQFSINCDVRRKIKLPLKQLVDR